MLALRRLIPLVIAIMCVAPACALAGSAGAGCSASSSASALDQYCEDLPTSRGPSTPDAHTHALAAQLPRSVVHEITAHHDRRLLTLPAAGRHVRLKRTSELPAAGGSSLPWWLFLILAAILAALVWAAIAKRRRDSASPA
jgi:LPXTG-motif cell wall-anchored protein